MIEQLKTIREALEQAKQNTTHGQIAWNCKEALTALTQLEATVGKQEPVHWRAVLDPEQAPQQLKTTMHVVGFREKKAAEGFAAEQIDFYGWRYTIEPLYAAPVAQQPTFDAQRALEAIEALLSNIRRDAPSLSGKAMGFAEEVAAALRHKVAQQPQEIEVQCPVCNHKFYEWPNDKQPQAEAVAWRARDANGRWMYGDLPAPDLPAGEPELLALAAPQQAEAVPVVDRVYEAAKRLVDHADFQLGGVLSAKSKARDIPSNAASKVKARHLASLRDALAKTPQQAEAVPAWTTEQITAVAQPIAVAIAENCRTAPQLVFPHLFLGLKDLLTGTAPQQAEAVPLFAALKVEGPRFHCAKVYGRIYQVLAVGSNKEDLLTVARLAKDAYYKQFPGTHEYKEPPFEWVVEEVPTAQPKFQPTEAVPPDVVRDAERWRMLPAYFYEYQIDAMKLYRDIDAAIAQQKGASHEKEAEV